VTHLSIDAIACIVIVLGALERARCICGPWRSHFADRLALVMVSGGALGLALQIIVEGFSPSAFGTLFRIGVALHYARYLYRAAERA